MSKLEILAELPKLSPLDRTDIWEQIWRLEENSASTESERLLLDEAQAAYDTNPTAGSTWAEVEARLRAGK